MQFAAVSFPVSEDSNSGSKSGIFTDLKGNGRKLHSAIIGKIFPISEQCHHLKINSRGFLLYENEISCHPIGIPEILISYWFLLMILNRGDRVGHWWDPGNQFRGLIPAPYQLLKERDGGGNFFHLGRHWGDPEGTVFHYLQW